MYRHFRLMCQQEQAKSSEHNAPWLVPAPGSLRPADVRLVHHRRRQRGNAAPVSEAAARGMKCIIQAANGYSSSDET